MKIDGGCHCGYITYFAEVDADNAQFGLQSRCPIFSLDPARLIVTFPWITSRTQESCAAWR
jgi:hypothetical protein